MSNKFTHSPLTLSMLLTEFGKCWKQREQRPELETYIRELRREIFRRCDNMDISHREACAMLDQAVI